MRCGSLIEKHLKMGLDCNFLQFFIYTSLCCVLYFNFFEFKLSFIL